MSLTESNVVEYLGAAKVEIPYGSPRLFSLSPVECCRELFNLLPLFCDLKHIISGDTVSPRLAEAGLDFIRTLGEEDVTGSGSFFQLHVVGSWERSKSEARGSAAFKACAMLHRHGGLNDSLCAPRVRQTARAEMGRFEGDGLTLALTARQWYIDKKRINLTITGKRKQNWFSSSSAPMPGAYQFPLRLPRSIVAPWVSTTSGGAGPSGDAGASEVRAVTPAKQQREEEEVYHLFVFRPDKAARIRLQASLASNLRKQDDGFIKETYPEHGILGWGLLVRAGCSASFVTGGSSVEVSGFSERLFVSQQQTQDALLVL